MDDYRNKVGTRASMVAISANCLLTVFNIAVGLMAGSYALVSEGAHTLSDVITSIIAYAGFKIGQKPADKEHPLGHGRAEAISGLLIVVFLAIVAYEIITGAIDKIIHPELISVPSFYASLMAVFGIFTNYFISEYVIRLGKEIRSPAIIADGKHQRTDIYTSVAILISVVIANIGYPIFDPLVGLLIGLLIIKTAYGIGKENIDNIMGKVPSQDLINRIKRVADSTPNAQGAHNIKVDYLGSYATAYLHVEVDGNMSLNDSHIIAHQVENNILKTIPEVKSVMVHVCPIGLEYDHNQEIDN